MKAAPSNGCLLPDAIEQESQESLIVLQMYLKKRGEKNSTLGVAEMSHFRVQT